MDEQKIIAAILAAGCIVASGKKTDANFAATTYEDCLAQLRQGKGSETSVRDRLDRAQERLEKEDADMKWSPPEPPTHPDT